jgi:tetratricopeptide (TPR) repeat protein
MSEPACAARSAKARADSAKSDGVAALADKDYEEALSSFRRAEDILDEAGAVDAEVHWHLARTYDQFAQVVPALRYFKKYLGGATARNRTGRVRMADAERAIERLQLQLDRTSLSLDVEPDGVEVRVDRRDVGVTPLEPVNVSPGAHQVTFWKEGFDPLSVDVEANAGGTTPLVARLSPTVAEVVTPPPKDEAVPGRLAIWAGFGVGGVALAGAFGAWAAASGHVENADASYQDNLAAQAAGDTVATKASFGEVEDATGDARVLQGTAIALGVVASLAVTWAIWEWMGK